MHSESYYINLNFVNYNSTAVVAVNKQYRQNFKLFPTGSCNVASKNMQRQSTVAVQLPSK